MLNKYINNFTSATDFYKYCNIALLQITRDGTSADTITSRSQLIGDQPSF